MRSRLFETVTLCSLGLAVAMSNAEAQKGTRGLGTPTTASNKGTSRAVIVGVSKYTSLASLQFADNDAEALHEFLVSPKGGGLDPANVDLFLNEKARRDTVGQALMTRASQTKPGDRLFFYFAGHGDVQRIGASGDISDAYLLLTQATRGIYSFSNDAINPRLLAQEAELYLKQNGGGELIIMIDACRAGAVADTREGAQATLTRLGQWPEVNKMLSSTGEQLSYENAIWGGGHGAFTYYLIEALHGLADVDSSASVTFDEVNRYVMDSVSASTERAYPNAYQTPLAFSSRPRAVLFSVSRPRAEALLAVRAMRSRNTETVDLGGRSTDSVTLPSVVRDTAVNRLLNEFQSAIAQTRLLEPELGSIAEPSAWVLQEQIVMRLDSTNVNDAALVRRVRGTLAVALRESAEEPARRFLRGVSDYPQASEFRAAGRALEFARRLRGSERVVFDDLVAREQFMKAFAIVRERDLSRFDEAERMLNESLKADSGAAPIHAALAALFAAKGDYASAQRSSDRALELAPRWEYAHKLRADLFRDQGLQQEALDAYAQLLTLHPGSGAAYNNRGVLFMEMDRYTDARRDFASAWERLQNPLYLTNLAAVAINQERLNEADSLLTLALGMDSTNPVTHYQRGLALLERKDGAGATESLERAAQLDPFDSRTRNDLGEIWVNTNAERAERDFRSAIALDPLNSDAYWNLAELLRSTGREREGERLLIAADSAMHTLGEPAYQLAVFYENSDRTSDAERWYREAIQRDSRHYWARIGLAELLGEQRRAAEAASLFEEAIGLFNGNPIPALHYARYLYASGEYDRAAAAYERVALMDPLHVRALAELAELRAEQGRVADAVRLYRDAMRSNSWRYPSSEVSLRFETRAAAQEFDGNLALASALWQAARDLAPDRMRPLLGLARIAYTLGNMDSAQEHLSAAFARAGTDESAARASLLSLQVLVQLDLGDAKSALARLDEADSLRTTPDRTTRALVLWMAGDRETAREMLREAREQRPAVPFNAAAARHFEALKLSVASPSDRSVQQ